MIKSQSDWEAGPPDDVEGDLLAERLIDVTNDITEVFTKDIRTTAIGKLGLPCVKSAKFGGVELSMYPLIEVITDYGTEPGIALNALLEVLAKSDCPLVKEYRLALAERYVYSWASDIAEVKA